MWLKWTKYIGQIERFSKLQSKTVNYVEPPSPKLFINVKANSETHEGLMLICIYFLICFSLNSLWDEIADMLLTFEMIRFMVCHGINNVPDNYASAKMEFCTRNGCQKFRKNPYTCIPNNRPWHREYIHVIIFVTAWQVRY